MTAVPIRRSVEDTERYTGRILWENGGGNWSNALQAKECHSLPAIARNEVWNRFFLRASTRDQS